MYGKKNNDAAALIKLLGNKSTYRPTSTLTYVHTKNKTHAIYKKKAEEKERNECRFYAAILNHDMAPQL